MRLIVGTPVLGTRHHFTWFVNILGIISIVLSGSLGWDMCEGVGRVVFSGTAVTATEGTFHFGSEGHVG